MNPFDELFSLAEAAEMLGIEDAVLRRAIRVGNLIEGVEAKKFGKQWVVTRSAIERYRRDFKRHGYGKNE